MEGLSRFYLATTWAFFILLLTTSPLQPGEGGGILYTDKIIHAILFGVFTFLFLRFLQLYLKSALAETLAFIASSSYALVIELTQFYIPGRELSLYDFLFGVMGAFGAIFLLLFLESKKPKLLLHVCCIGCGAYVAQVLKEDFRVVLFFYNPNIYPKEEYDRRLNESRRIAKRFRLKLLAGDYEHEKWLDNIKGHENDPERGERCSICYKKRLGKTAQTAKKNNFKYFTSTLSISPHKDANKLSEIGKELANKYGLEFLDRDFKKKDGFKNSLILSKDLGLYRQDYCGCEFSLRDKK